MRKLLLVLFIPFIFSCVEEDNPDSVVKVAFSVTAASNYFGMYDEAYIILHDLNGTPVDYRQIHDGETVEFQVDKGEKYHVTEYKTDDSSGKHNTFIVSWLLKDLSEDMVLESNPAGEIEYAPNLVGEFQVNVANSEPIVSLVSARGYASTFNGYANSVMPTMKFFSDVDRYLTIASTESGQSRYQFIDNPEMDKTYELKYEDMSEFDHILKLPVSDYASVSYSIFSINPESAKDSPGFIIKPDGWNFKPEEFYEIGYIGEVDNYKTTISGKNNSDSKTSFLYQKHGLAPSKIEVIDIDEIEVLKSKITDFEIGTVVDDVTYTSSFSSPLSYLNGSAFQFLQWIVESGSSTKFALELPEELKSANNLISNLDELRITSVSMSKYLQENGYESDHSYEFTRISQTYDY